MPDAISLLDRDFYARPAPVVARELLNKVFVAGELSARIVETEAYGGSDDPASHGHRRRTERNGAMFGPPGHLYVYFTYGMHYCVCVVTGEDEEPSAVLIRAGEPLAGLDAMRPRRPKARIDRDLTNGPAKFAAAFGLTTDHDRLDLCGPEQRTQPIYLATDGTAAPSRPASSTRVGLTKGTTIRWRWYVRNNQFVSPGRPS